MIKHYVEFYYPGIIVADTSVCSIESRDQKIDMPKGAYGYRFFDREEIETSEGETLRGDRKSISALHVFGKKLNLEEAKQLPRSEILVSNMRANGWKYVVKTDLGNIIEFREEDVLQ